MARAGASYAERLRNHPEFKAYAALASVCVFWGTTYLAIRIALEAFSPAVLVSLRFWLAGLVMLGLVRALGHVLPRGRDLWSTALFGALILGGGNGALVYSERIIPSSLAALFITLSPFWFAAIEAAVPGGEPLRAPVLGGILCGFAGVALLIVPDLWQQGVSGSVWKGFLLLQCGSVSWVLGSVLQKRRAVQAHPFAVGAVQQLAAGIVFTVPALMETDARADWSSPQGVWAVVYLVTFGSIIGFSSYIYALEKLPVAMVSLYTYINPVVAAALGWLVYREPFGRVELAAMSVIFTGVWIVKRFSARR